MNETNNFSDNDWSEIKNLFNDITYYDKDGNDLEINPLTYVSPEGNTCLHIATIRNNFLVVKLLIEAGLDVNAKDDMGCTPLYFADAKGYDNIKELLTNHGGYLAPQKTKR